MVEPSEPLGTADEEQAAAYPSHRAPALLAVVRIISVLGMSFFIAFGLFLLLGAWWLSGALSLIASLPFFALMRFVEKFAESDEVS